MAGPVTTHLVRTIQNLLHQHRIIVWYDPERCFDGLAHRADTSDLLGSVRVLRFEGSYFELRREAEPLLAALRAGRPAEAVLIYVPRGPLPAEQNVLLPVEAAGGVFRSTLSDAAREALRGKVPNEKVDEWRALPGITLAKLDELAEGEEDIGVLAAVFGKIGAHEVGYRFLRSEDHAETIKQQKLVEPLRTLIDRTFGVAIGPEVRAANKLRDAFAQRVLLHEFLDDLDEVPAKLDHLRLPERPAQVAACRELATRLRESKLLEAQYRAWAHGAEELFGLRGAEYDPERLGRCDTFEFEALAALTHARELAASGRWTEARVWIEERQRSFWAETDQPLRMQWYAMALAVDLWLAAAASQTALPGKSHTIERWVAWYTGTEAEAGWRMDRLLRRLDALSGTLLDEPELEEVARLAREKAAAVEQAMAERFWDRLQMAPGDLGGVPQQPGAFDRFVQPLLGSGKGSSGRRVIYVLADALRYEMAQELADLLGPSGRVEVSHAVAALPSITRIGMSALVPGAQNGLELVEGGNGIVARIGGEPLPGLESRRKRFSAALGDRVRDISLDACLSLTGKQLEGKVKGVDLLLLRSQDLDELGELDNLHQARKVMSQVIPDLHRGINRLVNLGFDEVVVCSDHGFLLRDDIDDAMKLAPPPGQVLELHRRCAVGRDLGGGPHYAVFKAGDLGLGGDLELAFPRGINVFRTSGNMAYHHGGVSLQELVVPVLHYTPAVQRTVAQKPSVDVELKDAKKITNGIFAVVLSYQASDLFEQGGTRRFRVTAVSGKKEGEMLGAAMQATHGFHAAGGEVELESGQSSVLLMMINDPPSGSGDLVLRVDDVEAGETIAQKKVRYDFAH